MNIPLLFKKLRPFITVVLFLVALGFVHQELKVHGIREILSALKEFPIHVISLSLLLLILNYLLMVGYDLLALRYLRKQVPLPKTLLASMVSFAITNTTGNALIAGSSVRYRFYNPLGLSGIDIIKFILFCSSMNFLGTLTLFSIATIGGYQTLHTYAPFSSGLLGMAGLAVLLLLGYWALVLFRKKPFIIRDMEIALPSPKLTLAQTLFACAESLVVSLILYSLISVTTPIPFQQFLTLYLAALVLATFSQVPGGIGVFEGAFLFFMRDLGDSESLVAALLLYRVIYYFFPLALAGAALLFVELREHRIVAREHAEKAFSALSMSLPHVLSILLVLTGALLLISGATPTDHASLQWLKNSLPLPVMELSHFMASIVGLLLLLIARAVRLRIDAAYIAVVILLIAGIILSLLKGLDWQEALLLSAMLALFMPSRKFFHRKSSLLAMPFSPSWLAFVGIVLLGALWIGLFSYQHVEYSNELWWRFTYQGDAPRFLRSTLTLAILLAFFSLLRLFKASPIIGHLPDLPELNELEKIVRQSARTQSYLALLGDKEILWNEAKTAFIMYRSSPNYWIAMGDPVGTAKDCEDLVWTFRDAAHRQGAQVAFYQVSKDTLPLYLDAGLILIKIGEEARVPLSDFGLQGSHRSGLRQTTNKFAKNGVEFSILEQDQVSARLPELKAISDDWLATKQANEKSFSLGFFKEDYLARTRVAVALLNGKIVAFTNILELENKSEVSLDLMRFTPEAPSGTMEYLFIQTMLWGKEQNYIWFNLGMAPLAGLETHSLAPLWHKIGNIIFEHGEKLYNFEGLHAYKEKFDPVWEPRYIAAPALKAPAVLFQVTTFISGGWKGVLKK